MFSRFRNAGRNIVTSIADGIRGAISSVTRAITSVTEKIRGFLPFSPADEGPLTDIHRLNFSGPVADSIERGQPEIEGAMDEALALPEIGGSGGGGAAAGSTEDITNAFARMFEGATFYVRDDSDIEKIVREIYKKFKRKR